jgi:hypothetical protein
MATNPTGPGGLSGVGGTAVGPGGGGTTPGLVSNWLIQATQRTPWVRSPTVSIDAVRINFATVPHGVEALVMVPYSQFTLEGADLIVQPIATGIEVILDIPAADTAWYIEDTDAAGLLQGFIEYLVSVQSPNPAVPGPLTSTVIVPISQVADYTSVQALLDAEKAKLSGLPGAG